MIPVSKKTVLIVAGILGIGLSAEAKNSSLSDVDAKIWRAKLTPKVAEYFGIAYSDVVTAYGEDRIQNLVLTYDTVHQEIDIAIFDSEVFSEARFDGIIIDP